MRAIKISIISLVAIGLTACSTVNDRYGFFKDDSQTYRKVKPIERTIVVPQNLNARDVEDYYEVPQPVQQSSNMQPPPPITPPGSNLTPVKLKPVQPVVISQQDRIRKAENAKIQGHTAAAANEPTQIGVNLAQAWVKVGHILQASNYKVVEKDKVLGIYYVIDTRATGGKVKKDMPIYQIHMRPSGNSTIVTVSPANAVLQNQLNKNLND